MKQQGMPMAWNEPGGGKNNQKQNPWNRGNSGKDQGPPDLDQIIKKFYDKLKENFRGRGGSGGSGNGGGGSGGSGGGSFGSGKSFFKEQKEWGVVAALVIIVLGFLYIISGIYIVQPPERAVITRFGKYVATKGPGPHWLPTFIESKEIVNVEQVHTSDHSGLMLTKDRNIASVGVAVQYRIADDEAAVREYLFNVVNPIQSLKLSAESALRQVIGQSTMDEVLTLKRAEIATAIKEQTIETLKPYHTGIEVLDVAMQFAKAPDEVRAAFDDVIKAAADEERLINQARAYENEVLPKARAAVGRLNNEALGYKEETILIAEGNVQRFDRILPEYKKAPKVTQTRLYLDTMEQIFRNTTKMLVENNGNSVMYLPLDKLMPAGLPPAINTTLPSNAQSLSSANAEATVSGIGSHTTMGSETTTGQTHKSSASLTRYEHTAKEDSTARQENNQEKNS